MSLQEKETNSERLEDLFARLENAFIESYLRGKGITLSELSNLPESDAKSLMREASIYASGKMAEIDLKSHFINILHVDQKI
jgi:hypothetical protein